MTGTIDRKLILEDGQEFYGSGFGAEAQSVLEIVFNTSMAGYQEILSDPSYTDQAVVMTYPLIGNYGMLPGDDESEKSAAGALIVRDYEAAAFHCGDTDTLGERMRLHGVPGVAGIDTRELTRSIRDLGSRKVLITGPDMPLEEGLAILRSTSLPRNAVSRMSCRESYRADPFASGGVKNEKPLTVAVIDCGMKKSILTSLRSRGCRAVVMPWNTGADEIAAVDPDGILISNGPGDPRDVPETVQTIKALRGHFPIFGICLGHQIVSLAYGASIFKLKFGHRGGNHPVKDISTGRIGMTAQNHSYAVDESSLRNTPLKVTHINLLDHTVEGVSCEADRVFSVQYHPEGAPGPGDYADLFDRFVETMQCARC